MKPLKDTLLIQMLISERDIEEVRNALKELSKDTKYVDLFIERLKKTLDPLIRGTIAIYLSDLKVEKAVPIIMSFIRNRNYKDVSGGLVYAMQNFDCTKYLMDFVKLVCVSNYEVRELSLQIIEEQRDSFTDVDRLKAIKYIERFKKRFLIGNNEDLEYLNYCITLLK